MLVGSGNPEEGELRPQLLDRFGMHAEIRTVKDPTLRVKVVEERTSFDQDPMVWIENYEAKQQELRDKLVAPQQVLPTVEIDYDLRIKISEVYSRLDVDGLRGDIVTNRAAKAHAAYNERDKVTVEDIASIITLCLRHRLRKDPLESIDSGDKVSKIFNDFSTEAGDPNKSLLKLPNPKLSFGIRKKITTIKKILIRNENNFIILLNVLNCSFTCSTRKRWSCQFCKQK